MSSLEKLDQDTFKLFLDGQIKGSDAMGASYVLTLLQLVSEGIFFLPGFTPSHVDMLASITGKTVKDVGFAGRVSEVKFSREISLMPSGRSIRGYQINGVPEMQSLLNSWLDQMGDERKVGIGY